MMINADTDRSRHIPGHAGLVPAQKVLIVNGSAEILEVFESVLEAGHYDVVFVESTEHAYSQIKRVRPDLVILCVRMDQIETLHVLSMLKLDPDTRDIPTLTYAAEVQPEELDEDVADRADSEMFVRKPAVRMN
jgi:CheY-like chemotaxis protein